MLSKSESERLKAVVVDVDGTLALHIGRDPYDWRSAGTDMPNEPVVMVLRALAASGLAVVYVSGRSESARELTERWLADHVGLQGELHLRAELDGRRDAVVKREIYETRIRHRHEVVVVLDDRDQVVRMWRDELGLTCLQVTDGNF